MTHTLKSVQRLTENPSEVLVAFEGPNGATRNILLREGELPAATLKAHDDAKEKEQAIRKDAADMLAAARQAYQGATDKADAVRTEGHAALSEIAEETARKALQAQDAPPAE